VVVVAGEDANDRTCMRLLLEAFCPDMRGRIVEIKDSVRLRLATGKNLTDRVDALSRKVRARAERENAEVACVFVHEDFDACDGDELVATRKRVQDELEIRLGTAHYVLAAWEIEAWLLLFPEALAKVVVGWRVPQRYRARDTGLLSDPKRILTSELGKTARRYRESDAPAVIEKVVTLGHHRTPAGSNRSWDRFTGDAAQCCTSHVC
jgi:hypothetical protein